MLNKRSNFMKEPEKIIVKDLRKSFEWLGDLGAYYFLWVVNEPVPSYEDWCKSRGVPPKQNT